MTHETGRGRLRGQQLQRVPAFPQIFIPILHKACIFPVYEALGCWVKFRKKEECPFSFVSPAGVQLSPGREAARDSAYEPGEVAARRAPDDVLTGASCEAQRHLHHHSLTFAEVDKWVFNQFSELVCLEQWNSMWFHGGTGRGQ